MNAFFAWCARWFREALDAVSRPASYREAAARKPGAALAHLAILALLILVLPASVVFFRSARLGITAVDEGLRTHVPPGTVFSVKDGRFSNTLPGPLVLSDGGVKFIVNDASSTLDLSASETGVVVDATGVTQHFGSRTQRDAFSRTPDFSVTREQLVDGIAHWTPVVLFVGGIAVLLLVFAAGFAWFAASAALGALVFWLALKLFKRPWPWKQAFVVTAYASTGPLVLRMLLSFARTDLDGIPSALYWLLLAWMVYDVVKRSPAPGKDGSDERKETDGHGPRPQGEG